jgi:hypothetical protein
LWAFGGWVEIKKIPLILKNKMKQKTIQIIQNIIIIGLSAILIIMYLYPYIIDYMMCHYSSLHNFSNAPSERGTFGDMYGALNSFLSGLAVLGIILTLFWDKTLKNDELEHRKSEKIKQEVDKLIYLENLLQISHTYTVDLKNRLNSILDSNNQDFSELPAWQIDINFENLKTINKTINQEKYFFAYRNQIGGTNILNTFSACRHIEEFENIQRNKLISEINKSHSRKIEYLDNLKVFFDKEKQYKNSQNDSYGLIFFSDFENKYRKQVTTSFSLRTIHEFIQQSLIDIGSSTQLPFFRENLDSLKDLDYKNWHLNEDILSQLQKTNVGLDSSITALENELVNLQRLRVIS